MSRRKELLAVLIGWVLIAAALGVFFGRYSLIRVTGGSMRPALVQGDLCVIERRLAPIRGRVVLIRKPGHGAVLHRVTGSDSRGFITRGDANPTRDLEPASRGDIKGCTVAVVSLGKLGERWHLWPRGDTLPSQSNMARR